MIKLAIQSFSYASWLVHWLNGRGVINHVKHTYALTQNPVSQQIRSFHCLNIVSEQWKFLVYLFDWIVVFGAEIQKLIQFSLQQLIIGNKLALLLTSSAIVINYVLKWERDKTSLRYFFFRFVCGLLKYSFVRSFDLTLTLCLFDNTFSSTPLQRYVYDVCILGLVGVRLNKKNRCVRM